MQEQKERARKAREALGDLGWAGVEFGKDVPETEFVGYGNTAIDDAKIVALVVENEQAEELMPGVEGIMVLDKTPFYAEMGGQVADHGVITAGDAQFQVTDVQKNKGGKYMHYGKLTGGVLKLGCTVTAAIDVSRRKAIMRARPSCGPTPPPTCWTRPCAPCWATTSIRPAPWWRRTGCASTSPTSPP